jgi:hypothetical protein
MKDKRIIVVFLVFIAIMAGIFVASRLGSDSNASEGPGSDTATTSTVIALQTTTTVFDSNNGKAILEHIIDIQNNLLSNPDVNRVGEIMDPSCSCYTDTRNGLQTLVDNKWHVQGDTLQMRTTAVLNDSPSEKTITATFLRTDNPTVDVNGKVQEKPTSPSFTNPFIFTIKKNANGVWLIYNRTSPEESKK